MVAPTILTGSKTTADPDTIAQLRWLCQHDLWVLASVILNSDNPTSQLCPPLHRELCTFIHTTPYRKNLYLMSRGYLKTSFITIWGNVQRILRNPEIRILIASNKAENAQTMLAEIKVALQHPLLLWLFPDVLYRDPAREADQWTTSSIIVKRKRRRGIATVETIGASGEITSRHYDHAVFDDLVGRENYSTRDLREATKLFIRQAQPLLDPTTTTQDYVGTPWHYDDAYADLLARRAKGAPLGVFMRACWRPDPEGDETAVFGRVRSNYPEKFPVAELVAIRDDMGPSEFSAQYLIDPMSADTAYLPRDKAIIVPRAECPPLDTLWIVMTVDPAISLKAWADYSAIATVGYDADGFRWVLDLRRGRWTESELVAQVYDAWAWTRGVRAIGFEMIGFAKIFRRIFTAEGQARGQQLPIMALERDTRVTKNVRLRALEVPWHKQQFRFLGDAPALQELLHEAEVFRPDRENAHDDLLDALVDADQLRLKPEIAAPDSPYDDPELAERADREEQVQERRRQGGHEALEHLDLQIAVAMQRRREAWDEMRAEEHEFA